MGDTVFPFPGGKSRFASWILEHVPEHTCFVEVFGGAAGVLVNKDPETSDVEVYNDADGDLVHFFEVLRERPEDFVAWLELVPYSREVHADWVEKFYHGYRPGDDVARAGMFFALRYMQWGSGYAGPNGFATSKVQNEAQSYDNKISRLEAFAERFDQVVIEHLDWRDVLEKYDAPETVFYCDPPYVGKDHYYPTGEIDHDALVQELGELEGRWLCSYEQLPEGLDVYHVIARGEMRFIGSGTNEGGAKDATERLVMNFDPDTGERLPSQSG